MKRTASAVWNGSIKEGSGTISTQSTVLNAVQYSFNSRFAEGVGTNPEELIAASHAGCFSMKLSGVLGEKGFTATAINTSASVNFDLAKGEITTIHLTVRANVPNITAEQFQEAAADAKANCPISKLLKAEITMNAELQ